MTVDTPGQVQLRLDGMTEKAKRKHPEAFAYVQAIVLSDLKKGPCYPDEMTWIQAIGERQVIGPAIRSLLKSGKVRKTGNYRRSLRRESAGRVVWELALNA